MKKVLIKDSDNYFAREDGKIIGKTGTVLKSRPLTGGYHYVSVKINGKFVTRRVHRLIAQAFIPNPENKPEVNHKDGDKSNNAVSNLEWVTSSENGYHAVNVLGLNRGGTHGMARMTDEVAHTICQMLVEGYQDNYIAEKLGVSKNTVGKIRRRTNWTHVSKDYEFRGKSRSLSENTVRWICHQLEKGLKTTEILELATNEQIKLYTIQGIKARRIFKNVSKDFNF